MIYDTLNLPDGVAVRLLIGNLVLDLDGRSVNIAGRGTLYQAVIAELRAPAPIINREEMIRSLTGVTVWLPAPKEEMSSRIFRATIKSVEAFCVDYSAGVSLGILVDVPPAEPVRVDAPLTPLSFESGVLTAYGRPAGVLGIFDEPAPSSQFQLVAPDGAVTESIDGVTWVHVVFNGKVITPGGEVVQLTSGRACDRCHAWDPIGEAEACPLPTHAIDCTYHVAGECDCNNEGECGGTMVDIQAPPELLP